MRLLGVIDLLDGCAVHARRGRREQYRPVTHVAGAAVHGDPLALAEAYRGLGLCEVYAADLDAIAGRRPQTALVSALAQTGLPLWLDGAIASPAAAADALAQGAARVIVGLETLPSWAALDEIVDACGPERVAFSLDLRNREPMLAAGTAIRSGPAEAIAATAVNAGVTTLIVLELARVGTGGGPDFDLMARVHRAVPEATLLAGGGVRGPDDIDRLAACGCAGALVATAVHEGRLNAVGTRLGATPPAQSRSTR